jgi:hypothetical protein
MSLVIGPRLTPRQIARVVNQLQSRPKYLYMYLDALFRKDPHLTVEYSDRLVSRYNASAEVG